MHEGNKFIKFKYKLNEFQKNEISQKIILLKNFLIENKDNLTKIFVITLFSLIYIYLYYCISKKIGKTIRISGERENKDKTLLIVKNAEGEPDTIAKVAFQNKIDYVPKISIIIHVHDIGKYFNKCIKTVISQTLKEIEIILIYNGPTYYSLDILKNYAKKDERITIILPANSNNLCTFNAGLTVSKGKYIFFMDSNDFIELNMMEEMSKKAYKEQSDIMICQCKDYDLQNELFNNQIVYNSLRFDLIPKRTFSSLEISKSIFQFSEGWVWEKNFSKGFYFIK